MHLFVAGVFGTLELAGMVIEGRSQSIPVLILGTPVVLFLLIQLRNTTFFRSNMRGIELAVTWGLAPFYLRTTILENTDGSSLFPVAVIAVVITLRAAVVPSTTWRTFWAGVVPMTVTMIATLLTRAETNLSFLLFGTVWSDCVLSRRRS